MTDCTCTGQDGELQAGVAWPSPRFETSPDGSRLDRLTGLAWAPNGASPTIGACTGVTVLDDFTWSEALAYVACLNEVSYLGHADWRLPNVRELESLTNAGFGEDDCSGSPCISDESWLIGQGFDEVGRFQWSSTTDPQRTDAAYQVTFHVWSGSIPPPTDKIGSENPEYAWPVRGGANGDADPAFPANVPKTGQTQSYAAGDDGAFEWGVAWPSPRFVAVTPARAIDQLTGLEWLADANCAATLGLEPIAPGTPGSLSWLEALGLATEVRAGAIDATPCGLPAGAPRDWRLPNKRETLSLHDFGRPGTLPVGAPFVNVGGSVGYWTSTSHPVAPESFVFDVDLIRRGFIATSKTSAFGAYAALVRGGAVGEATPCPEPDTALAALAAFAVLAGRRRGAKRQVPDYALRSLPRSTSRLEPSCAPRSVATSVCFAAALGLAIKGASGAPRRETTPVARVTRDPNESGRPRVAR